MKILVLNSGSSSQKSCLYEIGDTLPEHPPEPIWQAKVEWNGRRIEIEVETCTGARLKKRLRVESRKQALGSLLDTLCSGTTRAVSKFSEIDVVGHRVVNGGGRLQQPAFVTPKVKAAITRVSAFAPLHNRAELEGMEIVERRFGPAHQIAVFDTGFHRQLPEPAFVYPGPYKWLSQGIRR